MPHSLDPRCIRVVLILAWLLAIPSIARASTDIVVCNKGDVEILVASYKVYDTYDPVQA